jgi:hypothetical protein
MIPSRRCSCPAYLPLLLALAKKGRNLKVPSFLRFLTIDLKRQTRKPLLKSRIFSGDCTLFITYSLRRRQGRVG